VSQNVTLPDELFDRLRIAADQRGVSIEQFIDAVVPASGPDEVSSLDGAEDQELLLATKALLDGADPPIGLDPNQLKLSLRGSEPAYGTIEEAMEALRQREWAKDG